MNVLWCWRVPGLIMKELWHDIVFWFVQGVGGAVQYPKNYLKEAYKLVRERGGVCIADEVRFTGYEWKPKILSISYRFCLHMQISVVADEWVSSSLTSNCINLDLFCTRQVQTGFGRTGTHFWGFQGHDVIPDMVTMAKGIGNGFPMGAVVTTPGGLIL